MVEPVDMNLKIRVLVVDDEPTSREVIRLGLERQNCETMTAHDAASAISLLGDQQFHAVVTDKNMPGTDHATEGGLDVIKFAKESNPACAVIMVTGFSTVESAIEAMRLGAFDYLAKPVRSEDIKAKLERILSYQQTLNPANTIASHNSFREKFLSIIEEQKGVSQCLSSETKTALLQVVQDGIDAFFHERRAWENIILEQREALSQIAGWAEQMKEAAVQGGAEETFLDKIIAESSRRL
ncbi:MAG: response regulator [Deltaproteobacteria bacterium]|jgi:DNA-binding NtrC family response regulator|uniref:response regulator n=1 Tax=Hydrosulfovibrio ferrireducens TaxID=2934181 RepID=UPI0011F8A503|nr:MAG: response regulator [Deltaproteobacteria bacterium]